MTLKDDGYPPVLLTADLCRLFRCHENTLYRRIARGQAPAFRRTGGERPRYEWNRCDVESWLANRRTHFRRVA